VAVQIGLKAKVFSHSHQLARIAVAHRIVFLQSPTLSMTRGLRTRIALFCFTYSRWIGLFYVAAYLSFRKMRLSLYRKLWQSAEKSGILKIANDSFKTPNASFSVLRHLRSYEEVRPEIVKGSRKIPKHIKQPEYASTPYGVPPPVTKQIEIKTPDQIARMRDSCLLVRDVMDSALAIIRPGLTSDELDAFIHDAIVSRDAYPSPLQYRNYPRSTCISVNNVVCHGIPDSRAFRDGDLVSVDITAFLNGYHGDHCRTFLVGDVDPSGQRLVQGAERCRDAGVAVCGPGVSFNEIGQVVEELATSLGFTLVPYFNGHGIGEYFHGPPDIKHYANDSPRQLMSPGMTFTVEPVVCEGNGDEIRILDDGWTAVTIDGTRAAQFEHTVLITTTGVEILTV